jgi:CheY-like chemotaxis protein
MQIDGDVANGMALVVDGNPTSRSVLAQQLREFGFGTVRQVGRTLDAREILEHQRLDLVVCDYHFESCNDSGQDLLDELRREQILPYATVFMMLTGEATYQKVAEAAETALDSYLVKPFSANMLFERIREARQRKRALKDIFEAIEKHEPERAAELCLQRFEQRQLYWLYAARIGAELLLSLQRNAEALKLYDAVIAAKTVPWAKLGVARVQLADGEVGQARRTLEKLIAESPQHADSYDVLGKVMMEQGHLSDAMETYGAAVSITPGCILRLQHLGTLAFYTGDSLTAVQMLERTWALGKKSRLFDVLSMMLLALLRYDAGDAKNLGHACEVIQRFSDDYPKSVRLRRMKVLSHALLDLQEGRTREGLSAVEEAASEATRPDFDMEAATNMLSVWSRLAKDYLDEFEYETLVRQLARRFSVSRVTSEVLVAAVQREHRAASWIRETHAQLMQLAERAMVHAVEGQPRAAVENLILHGQNTGNAKLIELATLVAQRHRERIDDVEQLLNTTSSLTHRYCLPITHIAGVRRSNRSAGGLVLRR